MYVYKRAPLDPSQVFLLVRNTGTVTMPRGRGVVYAYRTNAGAANDGVGVVFPEDFWADGVNRLFLAGVVVGRPIYPGGVGSIQVWGHCDESIPVCYVTTIGSAVVYSAVTVGVLDNTSLGGFVFLEPVGMRVDNIFSSGVFIFCDVQNVAAQEAFGPTPCLVPWDAIIPDGATTYGTLSFGSYGTTRAFVRCLS